ncbi:MAG: TIGR02300 family protein [Pseudomonadota bacterium]
MANEELGTKRDCPNCSARFYDLNKDPALCPKCGIEFTPEMLLKPRRTRTEEETAKPAPEAEEDDEEDVGVDDLATSLKDADEEAAPAQSKRTAGLDEDEESDDEENIDNIDDIDVNIDENDDTLLNDDDDEGDALGGVVTNTGEDEER